MLCDSGRTEVSWRDVCRTSHIVVWYGCGVWGVFSKKWGVFNKTLILLIEKALPVVTAIFQCCYMDKSVLT